MKKTIISVCFLSVLSLTASAVTVSESNATENLENAIYSQLLITPVAGLTTVDVEDIWSNGNTTSDSSNNCFTLTATLRVDELKNYIGSTATQSLTELLSVHTVAGKELGVKIGSIGESNGYTGFSGTNSSFVFANYASTPAPNSLSSVDMSNYVSAAITFTHLDLRNAYRDSGATLTLWDAAGNATTYSGFTGTSLAWNNGLDALADIRYNSALVSSIHLMEDRMQGQVMYLNAAAVAANVPEPATATLSLLALAGLAARRRRRS